MKKHVILIGVLSLVAVACFVVGFVISPEGTWQGVKSFVGITTALDNR